MLKTWLQGTAWGWYWKNRHRLQTQHRKPSFSPYPRTAFYVDFLTSEPEHLECVWYSCQKTYGWIFQNGMYITLAKGYEAHDDYLHFWLPTDRMPWYYPPWPLILDELRRDCQSDALLRSRAALFFRVTDTELLQGRPIIVEESCPIFERRFAKR